MKIKQLSEKTICPSLTGFVHSCLASIIDSLAQNYGSGTLAPLVVVDATCGNGHDTLFLAQTCAVVFGSIESWRVLAFDVQTLACANTSQRIFDAGLSSNVSVLQQSHAMLTHYLPPDSPCGVVMFNLGYLPGSDKRVITSAVTTLPALEMSASCLCPGGVLAVHCYGGHVGGDSEMHAVAQWFTSLSYPQWRVAAYSICNKNVNPEAIYLAQKYFSI